MALRQANASKSSRSKVLLNQRPGEQIQPPQVEQVQPPMPQLNRRKRNPNSRINRRQPLRRPAFTRTRLNITVYVNYSRKANVIGLSIVYAISLFLTIGLPIGLFSMNGSMKDFSSEADYYLIQVVK